MEWKICIHYPNSLVEIIWPQIHDSNLYSVLTIYFEVAWIVVSWCNLKKKKSGKKAHYRKLNINDSSTVEKRVLLGTFMLNKPVLRKCLYQRMKEQFAWKKVVQFRLTAMLIEEKCIQKLSMLGDAENLNCYIFYLLNSAIANLIDERCPESQIWDR